MKKKELKAAPCKHCGSTEFITDLNAYDIWEVRKKKLSFVHRELTNDVFRLFCRECGEKLENADDYECE